MNDLTNVSACRSCGATPLVHVLSLGQTPLANSLLPATGWTPSQRYPLDLTRCAGCGLVQLAQIVAPDKLFSDYVYFSSNSDTMVRHAKALADTLIEQEGLGPRHLVVELASNDGYLLQFFQLRGVDVLGIEPAVNIARFAEGERHIPTLPEFFGLEVAQDLVAQDRRADVIIGNNVLAHVPALNGFVGGVARLLKPSGIGVFEVPYLLDMLEKVEFDTIYHEHQCYYSLTALEYLFGAHGLDVIDVERLAIHGGSLRVSVAQRDRRQASPRVAALRSEELSWQVLDHAPYAKFANAVEGLKRNLVRLVEDLKTDGARLVAYGAAAKGVTLTSYCQIGSRHLDYVVDRSIHKQGKRFPVDGLPIYAPSRLCEDRPNFALLLTWNFADEIMAQQAEYRAAGGRFVIPVPEPQVV